METGRRVLKLGDQDGAAVIRFTLQDDDIQP